jgi:hypothetical protein
MAKYQRVIEGVARDLGATVQWHAGRQKHRHYTLVLPDGTALQLQVSSTNYNDAHKIKTWAHQNIRRLLARERRQ